MERKHVFVVAGAAALAGVAGVVVWLGGSESAPRQDQGNQVQVEQGTSTSASTLAESPSSLSASVSPTGVSQRSTPAAGQATKPPVTTVPTRNPGTPVATTRPTLASVTTTIPPVRTSASPAPTETCRWVHVPDPVQDPIGHEECTPIP